MIWNILDGVKSICQKISLSKPEEGEKAGGKF